MVVEAGVPFGREGGSASRRERPAVNRELSCVFQGRVNDRRGFVVLEDAPRRPGSGEGPGGKRAESGEDALREPFGGVGVGGARSFVRISSRSVRSSSFRQAERRAPSLRCSSRAPLPCPFE